MTSAPPIPTRPAPAAQHDGDAGLSVVAEIGRGAQADVRRVRRDGTDYAMKVLRLTGTDDEAEIRAFRREAGLLASLDDPGLARVHEVGVTDGRPYLLMDLIEGERLALALRGGPLQPARAAALGADLVSALAAAHGAGLVHRDVKPDNILVTSAGAARLVDFGLAVRMDDEPSGEVAGTLAYSAPEQSGMLNRPVDGRTDLYALGAVLYECVTGTPPFSAADVGELLQAHAVRPVPDPRTAAPAVSDTFAALILRLLAKDPDDRYQSGAGVLHDLRRITADPTADFPIGAHDHPVTTRSLGLVGRDGQLGVLRNRWDATRAGRGGFATVHGAPGGGKSRLVQELAAGVGHAGHLVLHGKSESDDRQPLAAIRAAVDAYVRSALAAGPVAAATATVLLRAAAGAGAPLVKHLSPALAGVLAAPDIAGEVGQGRYAGAVAAFLAGLAREGGPVLLHLDDAQFYDDATVRVLEHLAEEIAEVPLLVVATARDDAASAAVVRTVTARLGAAHDTDVTVAPLDAAAVTALVAEIGGGLRISVDIAEALTVRSGGNPFTVLQYLKAIIDSGLALPSWGQWTVDLDALDDLRLPADATQLVLRRIDALDASSRRLLGVAAVVGPRFRPDVVAEVAGTDDQQVAELLAEAAWHGLVQNRPDGAHGFLHDWIREALLAQFTDDARRRLHNRIADVLDRRASGRGPDDPPAGDAEIYALAQHCAAGDPDHEPGRILRAGQAAGERALADHAPDAALYFLEHAAAAAAAAGLATGSRFGRLLGAAYHQSARFDEALAVLRGTLESTTDRRERVRILHLVAKVQDSTWGGEEQVATIEQGLRELGRGSPQHPLLFAVSSVWLFVLGCLVRATRIGYGSARGEAREGYRLQAAMYHFGGGGSLRALRPVHGLLYCLRIIYPINRLGHSPERARDLAALTMALRFFGMSRVADRVDTAARRIAVELADPMLSANIDWLAGLSMHGSGRDSGEKIRQVLAEQHRWLDAGQALDCYAALGWDWLLNGDLAEAQAQVARRQRWVEAGGQQLRSGVVAVDAGLLALRGRAGEAATRLGLLAGSVAGGHEQVDLISARLYAAIERDDLGASFDEAADEFDTLGLGPQELLPAQHVLFVLLGYGRVEQARRATDADRAVAVAAAYRAVRLLGRAARRPLIVAHHRVLVAACTHLGPDRGWRRASGPAAALASLDASASLLRAVDAPLVAYEAALVRARALGELGLVGEATRQARYALTTAEEQGWAHRARRLGLEFQLEAGGVAHPHHRSTALGGTRQSQRWAVLEQVSLAASRVLDLDRLAQIALDETTRILGAERALLFLMDPDTGVLRPHLGRDAAGNDLPELTGYSASLVDRVRHSRQSLVVTGTEEGEALGAQSAVRYGLRSILVAPLQLDDRLLGVVYLDSRVAKGIFTADDVDLLSAVTHHVAVAMETARAALLEVAVATANRQRDLAETLREAMARLSGTLDPELVLRRLLATVLDTPGGAHGWLLLTDARQDGARIRVLTSTGGDETLPAAGHAGLPVADLLDVDDAQIHAGAPPFASVRADSWISVPLDTRDGRVGVLVLAAERPDAFADADLGLAAALAGQGMVAYENARLFSRVRELATTDSLTGVANRRHFFELAAAAVSTAGDPGRSLAAVMIDIDHFKRINDGFGHQVGDDVIKGVVERLRAAGPPSGVLARYGGEEFVLLLPDAGPTAPAVAERLRAVVADTPVVTRGGPVDVTISLGLASWQPADEAPDSLLARADAGLYRAKEAGRNRVMAHDGDR